MIYILDVTIIFFHLSQAGGKGVISVLSNLYPRETEMFAQVALKGDLELARKMAYDLNDVSKYLFIDVNPIMPKRSL